jgi:formylmethanofuran dehydrogenase subunit E
MKEIARVRCEGCGIPIPEPKEEATWEELLCDTCLELQMHPEVAAFLAEGGGE